MTTFMARILLGGALVGIMVGLSAGPEAQAIVDARIEVTQPAAEASTAVTPAPTALCIAHPAEVYSHVGIADEAVRPFASCLR